MRFSIVETQPGGGTITLLEYAITDVPMPSVGTPLNVIVGFTLACDATATLLQVDHTVATVSFCDANGTAQGQFFHDVIDAVHTVPRSETFGLAVADESGQLGSRGPTSSTFSCGGSSAAIVSEQEAIEVLRAKQRQNPIIQENGDSGWLGVYFDAEGTQCHGSITPGQPGTIYILAKLNGLTACGAAGAEFRFTGLPESWTVYAVANPNMFARGDPFGDGVIGVWSCDTVKDQTVVLYTVLVLATELEENVEFRLESAQPYSNPMFPCPVLLLCDFPLFSYMCAETSPCYVNPSSPMTCQVPLATANVTWGAMKSLYR